MGNRGGFLGNASEWYIESSLDILAVGDKEIQDQNDFQSNLPLDQVFETGSKLEDANNSKFQNTFYKEVDMVSQSNDSYSVAFADEYASMFLEKYKASEEYLVSATNYFVTEIENLCKEKYIIPETTPKIEAYLKSIKELFPEMESISEESYQIAMQFIYEIQNRDH